MSDRLRGYFGFPEELATLTLSLFIFGYCVGPLFWGPLSEHVRLYHYSLTLCLIGTTV